jgi:hypothetical protein
VALPVRWGTGFLQKRSVAGFSYPSTERLYQKEGNDCTYYPRAPGRPSRAAVMQINPSLGAPTPGLPLTAERATIDGTAHIIWLTGYIPTTALASPIGQGTLQDRQSRLESAASWVVTQVVTTDEGYAIAAAIREGRCASVSDGSFKEQHGTAA